ncbi:MAG TPA: hypothetical protein VJ840_18025 [Gemmatimonadaceae bacterium]|nr:hypothetical protein [Gemmatimonadaceae bacterium]
MPRRKKSSTSNSPRSAPELVVLSREEVERYEARINEICISISDPSAQPARLSPRFTAVLRLSFDDVVERGEPSDILFALEHASAITDFIERSPDARRIVVHCNMGMSRSPGVALGLCDLRGWATAELERKHPGWNRLVRSVMREAAQSKARREA